MLSSVLNNKKNIWYLLAVLAVTAVCLAIGMMLMTGAGKNTAEAKDAVGTVSVKAVKIDDSARYAGKLYDAKVEDINDTAKVVELFEIMGLEETIGEYTVEISMSDNIQTLKLSVLDPVQQADKKVFERNMKKYAKQMLVLIPQVENVEWSYDVINDKAKKKTVATSLDKTAFEEKMGKAPEKYGKSKDSVQKLLRKLAGKDK